MKNNFQAILFSGSKWVHYVNSRFSLLKLFSVVFFWRVVNEILSDHVFWCTALKSLPVNSTKVFRSKSDACCTYMYTCARVRPPRHRRPSFPRNVFCSAYHFPLERLCLDGHFQRCKFQPLFIYYFFFTSDLCTADVITFASIRLTK